MTIKNVTILGAGTMGSGIAQVAGTAGFDTILYDIGDDLLDAAMHKMRERIERAVGRGRMTRVDADTTLAHLRASSDFEDVLRSADYVIEAVPEDLKLKRGIFGRAEGIVPAHCILGTNTSTIMISDIAQALADGTRLIGIHFFNPVPAMRLIEVVMGPETSEKAYDATLEVARRMQKETVRVRQSPGFTTSRINALIGNEAFRMLEEGVASAADIDRALKLGLNHPMGPFEMVDMVGLDARLNNLRYLHEHLGETYRPSPLLEQLVAEGRLGRKSGRGVYRYASDGSRIEEPDGGDS